MSTRIFRGRKYAVEISERLRPDPIKVTVKGKKNNGSHHLRPDEAKALAFYLVKAAERASFMLTQAVKKGKLPACASFKP